MDNPEQIFMCRLAMALGKTLGEIAAMPVSEFATWCAFYQLEPWGCHVEDQRSAYMLSLFYQANSKPGTPLPTFYQRWPEEEKVEKQPEGNLHTKIKGFFAAYTERQNRKKQV
ncbi:hypothetical protein MRBLMC3_000143 [Sphingobium sp. LMC3-1-1.1]|uniref:phage tail assembly protein T n=1 Tax=Sphingobium sp. LMC3-1-1.1 TaxID=3135241 RepID=UPI0034333D8E